jgi:ABC-2 type transport system permease protein
MQIAHVGRALNALTKREITKFVQQRGRLLSALVRPMVWLVSMGAGFYNVFGVSIIPPYKTYISYQEYIVPGLLGMVLMFHGMQSSLSMVYDREMGVMRLLLTAPLPRWMLLFCKLLAGTALSIITCYVFIAVCAVPVFACDYLSGYLGSYLSCANSAFGITFPLINWLTVLPALIASGLMLGAMGLFLSVHIGQLENFASTMNFVIFPMFFFSTALYPLWRFLDSGAIWLYYVALANPFTHAAELIRFALYGELEPTSAAVVVGATVAFFGLAVIGYNPQHGMIRRAPQAQPA